jgi:hypothetical protein
MQIHHIIPSVNDGPGTYENGIPVCLDCHAEVESRSNMGRAFTAVELREHRDRWFSIVRDRPDILIRAARHQVETGPLEALLAELDYNRVAASGPVGEGFPPLATEQFRRAIATNALAALPIAIRETIHQLYALIGRINYQFDQLAHKSRTDGMFHSTVEERNKLRVSVNERIPTVISGLEDSLSPGD